MSPDYEAGIPPLEGEFVYHMRNETLSCLVIELRWTFAPSRKTDHTTANSQAHVPMYACVGTPIAMNWDCHLDWALTTECSFNVTTNQVEALYTVKNLGPEQVYGEGQVIVVNQRNDEEPVATVFRN
jgi:hypothetical protein